MKQNHDLEKDKYVILEAGTIGVKDKDGACSISRATKNRKREKDVAKYQAKGGVIATLEYDKEPHTSGAIVSIGYKGEQRVQGDKAFEGMVTHSGSTWDEEI